ncbi:hypothetical protein UA32_12190 [Photobacterium angustum]|uniref:Uncharacterized protein n=1 Tax=Photobacterium angustum TaxID=661 RepID=A0ABX5GYY0_PHOAN|nr:hypothetical protein [Photobacterium angustum]KJG37714.1 hypothetical protein UA32_12190 [Photobacterium angustum]PSX03953.1 hypothetical protein C0W27_20890 [Photobacterium angustum]
MCSRERLIALASIYGVGKIEDNTLLINRDTVAMFMGDEIYQRADRCTGDTVINGMYFKRHQNTESLEDLHSIVHHGFSYVTNRSYHGGIQ